jgi:hypothetical protein
MCPANQGSLNLSDVDASLIQGSIHRKFVYLLRTNQKGVSRSTGARGEYVAGMLHTNALQVCLATTASRLFLM